MNAINVLTVMDDASELLGREGFSAIPNDLIAARAAVAELIAAVEDETEALKAFRGGDTLWIKVAESRVIAAVAACRGAQ